MNKKTDYRWIIRIVLLSVCMSAIFTFLSTEMLSGAGYVVAFLILLLFILIGILFDIIGVSVTAAAEAPFHSMASHKAHGAAEAIRLIKNAEKVSSVCNDVVGDIAGIVSGSTSAIIVSQLVQDFAMHRIITQLAVSAIVAGLTIGGKAVGKTFAINHNTKILLAVGKLIRTVTGVFGRKDKRG